MRFGWLTLAHSGSPETDYAAIQDLVAQACFAETAGFDGIWLTEHNFTGESVYCDPIPFASVVAARTSRIRIGFAVLQLALRHPIRLATELALLDNLSGGRLGAAIMMGRIPLARVPERLAAYQAGLAESGLDAERQQKLREQAALWRFVHVAESQAQAEDELTQALLQTRRHMVHAREANNPADFQVEATRVNPWNDPRVSDEEGVRYSLVTSTLSGKTRHVAERIGELRDAGVHHVLCQMSYGYLAQTAILDSMQ